ncbi:MAG: UDP-N-acetylglucosamine 1-carboxyvinyltransferase, partial [Pirellulales bacterium]|nr:UDP-N-acetylglucosamine 1-carboxyvinyltransferase [Pirellulales bacterium]
MAREHLEIVGGRPLFGTVTASGAKNAALPIMAAALLAEGVVELDNVPRVADVATQSRVLAALGMHVEWIGAHRLRLFTVSHRPQAAPAELVHSMRASFCVLGPLLARRGRARVPLPGGCRIGPRPVDLHLRGLTALGADVRVVSGCVVARCGRLRGARVDMAGSRGPSVTGTANVLCAAVLARGETVIRGAAREPEIVDLGHFLQGMGARIEGLGTDCLRVQGVAGLAGGRRRLLPDRIEAGTFLLAGAMSGGTVEVREGRAEHLEAVLDALELAVADRAVPVCSGVPAVAAGDIRFLVQAGVDFIIGYPDQGTNIADAILEATAAGIPYIPYSAGWVGLPGQEGALVPGQDYLAIVGEDLCALGESFAEVLNR